MNAPKAQFPVRGGAAPWHLWGESRVIRVPITAGSGNRVVSSAQITKVNFRRPESWMFWFTAEIIGSNPASYGFDVFRACCNFNIIGGLGRSVFKTAGVQPSVGGLPATMSFAQFRWDRAPGANIPAQSLKWTTKGRTPILDEVAAGAAPGVVESFVAQDIQASALLEANMATPAAGQFIDVEVGMYFAPRVHVRPDWFASVGSFLGSETGGT